MAALAIEPQPHTLFTGDVDYLHQLEEQPAPYANEQDTKFDPWLERDRAERAADMAADCRVYSASLSSHVMFDKIHGWCGSFAVSKWFPSSLEIEFITDVALAARFALRDLPVLHAMYSIWLDGDAADIPAHILARSAQWYEVKRLVGNELKARKLDGTYFSKKRVRARR
jgi:hypothetical protein